MGAVAAGVGIALAAAPGTAFADDGAPSTSDSAVTSAGPTAAEPTGAHEDAAGEDATDEDATDEDADAVAAEDETVEEPETPEEDVEDEDFKDDDGSTTHRDAAAPDAEQAAEPAANDPALGDTAVDDADPVVVEAASESDVERTATVTAAGVSLTAPAALNQPSCGCDEPETFFKRISVELDQTLTATANWLALHPRVPFGPFLEAGVYLVRRTLFPASVGVITSPVKVKLHFTETTLSSGEDKLGIYLALGGSTTPQLFEFDTGSAGLFAAYSEVPGVSPWWGGNVDSEQDPVHVVFDSGLVYQGTGATTAVSLFTSADSCTAALSTGSVQVGQMDEIGTATDPTAYWGPTGSTGGEPPIQGAFYGDFGMALNDRTNGIVNVISQLTFGWGVRPGFLVHVDPVTNEAWMQVGLRWSDLNNDETMYFAMDPDPTATPTARVPNSNLRYYALQPFTATVNITDDEHADRSVSDPSVPILPDTGASTTLHNTQSSPPPSPESYRHLTDWTDEYTKGRLKTGLSFSLSGTTTSGQQVTFFEFDTSESTDGGRVAVQNEESVAPPGPTPAKDMYYLNSGRSMFNEYDLVYYLGNPWGGGTIGLRPHGIQTSERSKRQSK